MFGYIKCHESNLTPQFYNELPVPSQHSEQSCIYVLGISILPLFHKCSIRFWNYTDTVVFFVFILSIHMEITNMWLCEGFNDDGSKEFNKNPRSSASINSILIFSINDKTRKYNYVTRYLVLCVFCRSSFVLFLLAILLCCLTFFDVRIMMTPRWYLQTLRMLSQFRNIFHMGICNLLKSLLLFELFKIIITVPNRA